MSYDSISLEGGKYTVFQSVASCCYTFKALRYGEDWRDLVGDNLVHSMFHRILELQEELEMTRGQRTESNRRIEELDRENQMLRKELEKYQQRGTK